MADITINYGSMENVVSQLETLKKSYETEAETFQKNFSTATAEWTGATKDAVAAFIAGSVKTYTHDSVPGVITALKELLQANINQFSSADQQIAQNIPE